LNKEAAEVDRTKRILFHQSTLFCKGNITDDSLGCISHATS